MARGYRLGGPLGSGRGNFKIIRCPCIITVLMLAGDGVLKTSGCDLNLNAGQRGHFTGPALIR